MKFVPESGSFKHVLHIGKLGAFMDAASGLALRFRDGDQGSVFPLTLGSPQFTLRETCSKQCHTPSLLLLLTECQDAQSHLSIARGHLMFTFNSLLSILRYLFHT